MACRCICIDNFSNRSNFDKVIKNWKVERFGDTVYIRGIVYFMHHNAACQCSAYEYAYHRARVWQITAAAMSGPEADEFTLKVQQAATGHPWYSHAKPRVNAKLWFVRLLNAVYNACFSIYVRDCKRLCEFFCTGLATHAVLERW